MIWPMELLPVDLLPVMLLPVGAKGCCWDLVSSSLSGVVGFAVYFMIGRGISARGFGCGGALAKVVSNLKRAIVVDLEILWGGSSSVRYSCRRIEMWVIVAPARGE